MVNAKGRGPCARDHPEPHTDTMPHVWLGNTPSTRSPRTVPSRWWRICGLPCPSTQRNETETKLFKNCFVSFRCANTLIGVNFRLGSADDTQRARVMFLWVITVSANGASLFGSVNNLREHHCARKRRPYKVILAKKSSNCCINSHACSFFKTWCVVEGARPRRLIFATVRPVDVLYYCCSWSVR